MNESTITFPPYVRYILAVAIALLLVWALIKWRMEIIKEKLEVLKRNRELIKGMLEMTNQQKAVLDKKVNRVFRLIMFSILAFLCVLSAVVYNIVDWTPGEWSDYLSLSTIMVSVCGFFLVAAFRTTMSVHVFVEALYRGVEATVYRKNGFDVDKIQRLQAELTENKKECKDLKAELKKLDSCLPF